MFFFLIHCLLILHYLFCTSKQQNHSKRINYLSDFSLIASVRLLNSIFKKLGNVRG